MSSDTLIPASDYVARAFRRASYSVVDSWPNLFEVDDLEQMLWEWYYTRPSVQQKIALEDDGGYKLAVFHGHQLASGAADEDNLASGNVRYSTDDVKRVLRGEFPGRQAYIDQVDAIGELSSAYGDSLDNRYSAGEVPKRGSAEEQRLKRAVRALTDEMNRVYRRRLAEEYEPVRTDALDSDPEAFYAYIEAEWQKAMARMAGRRKCDRPAPPDMPHLTLAQMQKRDPFYPYTYRY